MDFFCFPLQNVFKHFPTVCHNEHKPRFHFIDGYYSHKDVTQRGVELICHSLFSVFFLSPLHTFSCSTGEEEFVASDKSDAESEVAVDSNDDSDFGSTQLRTARTRRPAKRQRSTRLRRRRRPRRYSDDEEETSEEEEEEMGTLASSFPLWFERTLHSGIKLC